MEIKLSEDIVPGYLEDVKNILISEEFLMLSRYVQHQWTNRLMHSVNVSYLSWLMAKKLGGNTKTVARAGLLHDFCLYDFKEKTPTGEHQVFYHPKVAARNSDEVFGISDQERDAILTHMFPLGPMPRNKEAWIITVADKICATMEFCHINIALARRNRVRVVEA